MNKQIIKNYFTHAFSFMFLLLVSIMATAQDGGRQINGKVTDEAGEALSGVNVQLKGSSIGVSTNDQGTYVLSMPAGENQILVFTYIGMRTEMVAVGISNVVNLRMESDSETLDEVVAIGYGTIRKKDLTGSVALINGEDLSKRNQPQLSQALQGSAPGVSVTRSSGLPGAGATIRIRGITTIGNSNPLILVDGIPTESIDSVNPDDVENISVLKDAASASIYGARASAGVILITTKRGKRNQLDLEYKGMYGIVKPTTFPAQVDHIRYMEMINEVAWNDGGNQIGAEYSIYNRDFINDYLVNHHLTSTDLYPITDWVKETIKEYAPSVQHGLSLSYGNDVIKTKASVNYENTEALYVNRSFERLQSRINNEIKINSYITAEINGSMIRGIAENTLVNPLQSAYKYGPLWTPYWSDGRVSDGRNGANTWARIHYGGFDNTWTDELAGRLALKFTPISDLTITGVVAPNVRKTKGKTFSKQIPYYEWNNTVNTSGLLNGHLTTNLVESRGELRTMTKQLTANYNPKLGGDHELSLMGGYEDYYRFAESLGASSDNFLLSEFPYLDRGPLNFMRNSGNANESAYNSYFGRVMYDYGNRYLFQANIRHDGSSRFHKDHRWATFPSFAFGWVLTEESFARPLAERGVDFFKIRASWGNLGNERIGNYPYQATMNFENVLFVDANGNVVSSTTAAQQSYNIIDVSWETTESWNVGFDAEFLNRRLNLTADYYKKQTHRMLLDLEIPDFMGYSNPSQNAGSMHTKGWETQLNWRDQIGDFRYSVSANLSDYRSIMGNLSGIVFDGNQITREGVEYASWYGYKSQGLFQSQQDVNESPLLATVVRPGDVKYVDISGPNGEPDGVINPEYDRVPLAGSLPRYHYGANLSMNYKGFDLYVMFQGVGKQTSRIPEDMVYQTSAWHTFPDFVDGNYYSEFNTPEQNAKARYPRLSQLGYDGNNYVTSDFWLIDGSYLRLKNLTLGYTLPDSWIHVAKLQNIRVYASGNDLLSFDKYPKGWDPEASLSAYMARTWNFGIQVRF